MISDFAKAKVTYEGRHYRNDTLAVWIIGTFKTEEEQAAAWRTVKFIRETWPETEETLRGKLMGIDRGET